MPEDKSTPVMVRLPREILDALDEYRRQQPDLPTRPEAIRRLVSQTLSVLPKAADAEAMKPLKGLSEGPNLEDI